MAGPFSPPFIIDQEAFDRMTHELTQRIKLTGRTPSYEEQNSIRDRAREYAYATEFSQICTAAVRGDWEPAKERYRRERAEKGEEIARALMRSYQRAVNEKLRTLR
jgi:hypothetical protein